MSIYIDDQISLSINTIIDFLAIIFYLFAQRFTFVNFI